MAVSSCTAYCPNLTVTRFCNFGSSQRKHSPNVSFKMDPKTTSFAARIRSQDKDSPLKEPPAIKEEEVSTPAVMSPAEQILRLAISLAERPLGFAVEVIAPPGSSFSQLSFRFLVAAVAVVTVLPDGCWVWSAVKAVVSGGFLVSSAACYVMSIAFPDY